MKASIILAATAIALCVPGASALDITLTPGSLASDMARLLNTTDARLTLRGTADVRDLALIKEMPRTVTSVDMKDLTIAAYAYSTGGYLEQTSFAANRVIPMMLAGTNVTSLILPASVVSLADDALALSRLTTVALPAGVTEVGARAFANCESLVSVTGPEGIKYGADAFRNCPKLNTVPAVTDVSDGMFLGCSSLTAMPKGVKSVGNESFRKSGVTAADLSGLSVGEYAFAECPALVNVTSDTGTRFATGVFFGDSGLDTLPEWNGATPALAVAHNAAANGMELILDAPVGDAAYAGKKGVTSLVLHKGVTAIGKDAFRNMSDLQSVDVHAHVPEVLDPVDETSFSGLENGEGKYPIELKVPKEMIAEWENHPVWSKFQMTGITTGGIDIMDNAEVTARRNGGKLTVTSTEPMEAMSVYSVSGIRLYEGGAGMTEQTVDIPSNEVVIVRVRIADKQKVIKL